MWKEVGSYVSILEAQPAHQWRSTPKTRPMVHCKYLCWDVWVQRYLEVGEESDKTPTHHTNMHTQAQGQEVAASVQVRGGDGKMEMEGRETARMALAI